MTEPSDDRRDMDSPTEAGPQRICFSRSDFYWATALLVIMAAWLWWGMGGLIFAAVVVVSLSICISAMIQGKQFAGLVWALFILFVSFIFFSFQEMNYIKELARRAQCRNNLKELGAAVLDYERRQGSFPPAYTIDQKVRLC